MTKLTRLEDVTAAALEIQRQQRHARRVLAESTTRYGMPKDVIEQLARPIQQSIETAKWVEDASRAMRAEGTPLEKRYPYPSKEDEE